MGQVTQWWRRMAQAIDWRVTLLCIMVIMGVNGAAVIHASLLEYVQGGKCGARRTACNVTTRQRRCDVMCGVIVTWIVCVERQTMRRGPCYPS